MPVYKFKLTDKDSGQFRVVSASAASPDEAVEVIQNQELKKVTYILPDGEVKDLEKKLKEGSLSGRDKARLFAHHQDQPYKIAKGG